MRTARYPEGRWELECVSHLDLMSQNLRCVYETSVLMIIFHNFITLASFKSKDLPFAHFQPRFIDVFASMSQR